MDEKNFNIQKFETNLINVNAKLSDICSVQNLILKDSEKLKSLEEKKKELVNQINDSWKQIQNLYSDLSIKLENLDSELQIYENKYITSHDFNKILKKVDSILIGNDTYYRFKHDNRTKFESIKEIYENRWKWHESKNEHFVKEELERYSDFFETIEADPLRPSQRIAVLTNDNANLVLAGAGSGKTSVLVANVLYLLKAGLATESEIILLAFNKDAADEITERLEKRGVTRVNSRTFHSFGNSEVILKSTGKKQTTCYWAGHTKQTNLVFRELIEIELKQNQEFLSRFAMYFIEDFKPYKNMFSFTTEADYIKYLNNKNLVTLNGEYVKSYEELMIANFLCLKNIKYHYEYPYEIETVTSSKKQYQPDFYLPEYNIYIEHFGIQRNGDTASFVDREKYHEGINWKRQIHQENKTILVETYSYEKMEENLLENLEEKLNIFNVEKKDINFEIALEKLLEKSVLDTFTDLIITYQGHFINGNYAIPYLLENAQEKRIRSFIELFDVINNRYSQKKEELKCIDYNDMISKALVHLINNNYLSSYKYIFVDEFQDISIIRNEMIKKLTNLQENSCIKVVGDDWQAINRFAGSDVMIVKNFDEHYINAKRVPLKDTFRFGKTIAKVSKKFIMKNDISQISKEINTSKDKISNIYLYWNNNEKEDKLCIPDVINKLLEKDPHMKELLILSRFWFSLEKNDVKELNKKYPNIDITHMSAHSSKGLGKDYVIIIGLEKGDFGFPSEKTNDPIIDSIMNNSEDFPYAEERRLFYVSLTRVKKDIVLVSQPKKQSSFVKELISDNLGLITELNANGMASNDICPKCKEGYLIQNKKFLYCTDSTFCKYKERAKPLCKFCGSKLEVDKDKGICYCEEHKDFIVELCPKCHGFLQKTKGKYKYGCSEICGYQKGLR